MFSFLNPLCLGMNVFISVTWAFSSLMSNRCFSLSGRIGLIQFDVYLVQVCSCAKSLVQIWVTTGPWLSRGPRGHGSGAPVGCPVNGSVGLRMRWSNCMTSMFPSRPLTSRITNVMIPRLLTFHRYVDWAWHMELLSLVELFVFTLLWAFFLRGKG